jgi:hypothetical protein
VNDLGLQPGDEVKCLHCDEWHRVEHTSSQAALITEVVRGMLYFYCPAKRAKYFAGNVGAQGKLERRRTKGGM